MKPVAGAPILQGTARISLVGLLGGTMAATLILVLLQIPRTNPLHWLQRERERERISLVHSASIGL